MKLFLAALTIWSLPFFGGSCGSAGVQNAQQGEAKPAATPSQETVTLTNEHPRASFSLNSNLFNQPPEILEVSVTKVNNPQKGPVNVFVYLSPGDEKKETDSDRISVGNFSLYPADRPGKFMLNAARGFQKLSETGKPISGLRLVFEMQTEQTPVEITIAEPAWKNNKR